MWELASELGLIKVWPYGGSHDPGFVDHPRSLEGVAWWELVVIVLGFISAALRKPVGGSCMCANDSLQLGN